MNNFGLNVTVPSLSILTPVGVDTYQLVARLFKSNGTPLDNPNIPNEFTGTVTTTNTNFNFDIPITDGTYSELGAKIELFDNNVSNCCFARFSADIINTENIVVTPEAVLLNQLTTGKVFRFEPSTEQTTELFTPFTSADIAHTATRLFVVDFAFDEGETKTRLREYTITLSPFTHSKGPDYLMPQDVDGAGLHAVSNTNLYIAGTKVSEINISGITAVPTTVFEFASGYQCTGDLVYDPVTELFLITYDNGTDYRIGVFERDGTIVRSEAAPVNNLYGMYQFEGDTYVVDGTGQIYSLNLTTLATTPTVDTNIPNAGASQIQSNISIPA